MGPVTEDCVGLGSGAGSEDGGVGSVSESEVTGGSVGRTGGSVGVGGLRTQPQTEGPASRALPMASMSGRQAPSTQSWARAWMLAEDVGLQRPGRLRGCFDKRKKGTYTRGPGRPCSRRRKRRIGCSLSKGRESTSSDVLSVSLTAQAGNRVVSDAQAETWAAARAARPTTARAAECFMISRELALESALEQSVS